MLSNEPIVYDWLERKMADKTRTVYACPRCKSLNDESYWTKMTMGGEVFRCCGQEPEDGDFDWCTKNPGVRLCDLPLAREFHDFDFATATQIISHFNYCLIQAMSNADSSNLATLAEGFPEYYAMWRDWHNDRQAFYDKYGL